MKEFIEKLIGRLSKEHARVIDIRAGYEYTKPWEDCYKKVKEIVNQLAEECNNGWIPYTTNGELPKEGQRVWLSFTNEVTSYVKDAWWQGKFFVWNNCHIVKDTPMAWKPYDIPQPYQPKGE